MLFFGRIFKVNIVCENHIEKWYLISESRNATNLSTHY